MSNNFYTYAYLREDGTPYYIGKGKDRRAYQRHKRGKIKDFRPKKSNGSLDIDRILILKKNLTEEQSIKHEEYMINVFGRKDLGTGILRNMTSGGDGISGYSHTDKTKRILSEKNSGENNAWYGKNHTEETRKKMRESNKNKKRKPHSEETKRKMKESAKKYWKDRGRDISGENNPFYGKSHTEETKKKISNNVRK